MGGGGALQQQTVHFNLGPQRSLESMETETPANVAGDQCGFILQPSPSSIIQQVHWPWLIARAVLSSGLRA